MRTKRLFSIIFFLAVFLAAQARAGVEERKEPTGSEVAVDIVLLRPLGLTATVLGSGIFVIGLPFTIPTGTVGLSARKLVVEPFRFTFTRPIGSDTEDY